MNSEISHFRNVIAGVRWNAIGQVLSQVTRFGVSIVLARLLTPADFGLLAMVTAITGFLGIFQSLGTIGVIIQTKELPSELLNSLYVVNLSVGVLLAAFLALGGPVVAWVYGNPEVTVIAQVLGVNFIISSFGLVPMALLNRTMRFDRLVQIEFVAAMTQSVVAVLLAANGWKVWALVAGTLTQSSIFALLCRSSAVQLQFRFHWSEVKKVMRFGFSLMGSHIIDHWVANADKLIIGRFLGATSLGFYSLAWSLYTMPVTSITSLLNRVMFPALSRIQDDDPQLRDMLLRASAGIAFLTFPLMAGLCVLAYPFVISVFGEKWAAIVPVLTIFCPLGIVHSVTGMNGNLLLAKGRSDLLFKWNLGLGVVTILSFFVGLPWGTVGVAAAYGVAMVPLACVGCLITFRLVHLSFGDWLVNLRGYAVAAAIMAGVVFACRFALERAGESPPVVVAISVLTGMLTYLLVSLWIRPAALLDFAKMLPERIRTARFCATYLANEGTPH